MTWAEYEDFQENTSHAIRLDFYNEKKNRFNIHAKNMIAYLVPQNNQT